MPFLNKAESKNFELSLYDLQDLVLSAKGNVPSRKPG
jgi:hypothetical protein